MVKYENGKIYRLVCNETGKTYYGSTCSTLSHRKNQHKDKYKAYLSEKYPYVSSFEIIENGNYDIFLVENFPCKDVNELRARERYYIENNECINLHIPNRTKKEYNNDNKDYYINYCKEYYNKNKEKWQEMGKKRRVEKKEELKEYFKTYAENNKDKLKEYKRQWYLKKKATFTPDAV